MFNVSCDHIPPFDSCLPVFLWSLPSMSLSISCPSNAGIVIIVADHLSSRKLYCLVVMPMAMKVFLSKFTILKCFRSLPWFIGYLYIKRNGPFTLNLRMKVWSDYHLSWSFIQIHIQASLGLFWYSLLFVATFLVLDIFISNTSLPIM